MKKYLHGVGDAIYTFLSSLIVFFFIRVPFSEKVINLFMSWNLKKQDTKTLITFIEALLIALIGQILKFCVSFINEIVAKIICKFSDKDDNIITSYRIKHEGVDYEPLNFKLKISLIYSIFSRKLLQILKAKLVLRYSSQIGQIEEKDGYIAQSKFIEIDEEGIKIDFLNLFKDGDTNETTFNFVYSAFMQGKGELQIRLEGHMLWVIKLICSLEVDKVIIWS